jgi:hypothetical protein
MAMNAGNSDCTTGLSKRIYDFWIADIRNQFGVTPAAAAHDFAKSLAYATARAVVDEIVANAEVSGSDIT